MTSCTETWVLSTSEVNFRGLHITDLDTRKIKGKHQITFSAFSFFLDPVCNLCLKDLSKVVMAELACKLRVDPTARQRFHQSFETPSWELFPDLLGRISKFFSDTPVKLFRGVFEELKLYDLGKMLKKIKQHTVCPYLSLLAKAKMLRNERPTKDYSKADYRVLW